MNFDNALPSDAFRVDDNTADLFARTWPSVTSLMHEVYDHYLRDNEKVRAIFEPRRIMPPGGFHSPKIAAAGLYTTVAENRLKMFLDGKRTPTIEITATTIAVSVINNDVPIYYVNEDFLRAVAATELPGDIRIEELNWPRPAFVLGLPTRFMQEYVGLDVTYINCANLKKGVYETPKLPGVPGIEVPKDKVGIQFNAWRRGRIENFVAAYIAEDLLTEASKHFPYIDYTGASTKDSENDSAILNKVAELVLKLFVILGTLPTFVRSGEIIRRARIKHGRPQSELWSANIIGDGFRSKSERSPTSGHASPKWHWRRGHITHQVIGGRHENLVPAATLPRLLNGDVDWAQVAPETKELFWKQHKRLWLQPVLINAPEAA